MPDNRQTFQTGPLPPPYDGSILSDTRTEMVNTLRGLRDTVAISFQTLNLTLSSMNSTLRTVAGALPHMSSPIPNNISYAPSPQFFPTTGSLSNPMANFLGGASTFDLMTAPKPYNISPMEWSYSRNYELRNRLAGFGVGAGANLLGLGASYGVANLATRAITGAFGITGGLSRFAVGLPVLGAAAYGIGAWADAIGNAADEHLRDAAGIRRMSNHFGPEFTSGAAFRVASSVGSYGYREAMNTNELNTRIGTQGMRNVLFQGLANNMFQGSTPEELVRQAESGAQVVKFLMGIAGSRDVTEAMQSVVNMKQAGVNMFKNPQFASALGSAAFRVGGGMGVAAGDLLNSSMTHGMQAAYGVGLPGYMGVMPMMQNQYFMHWMERNQMMSPAMLAAGGGGTSIAKTMTQAMMQMMQMPQFGQILLAGAMNGRGGVDVSKLMGNSNLSYFDMMNRGMGNATTPGGYAMMNMYGTDMWDQVAKAGDGTGQQQAMLNMANQIRKMIPFQGKNYRENQAIFAQTLMSVIPGLTDKSAALSLATQAMNPQMLEYMKREPGNYQSRGGMSYYMEQNSPFRAFADMQNFFGTRVPEYLKYHMVTRPGQWAGSGAYDFLDRFFPQDKYSNIVGGGMSAPSFDTLNMLQAMKEPPPAGATSLNLSQRDRELAKTLASYNAGGGAPLNGLGGWIVGTSIGGWNPFLPDALKGPLTPDNRGNMMLYSAALASGYQGAFSDYYRHVQTFGQNDNDKPLEYYTGANRDLFGGMNSTKLAQGYKNSAYFGKTGGALSYIGSLQSKESLANIQSGFSTSPHGKAVERNSSQIKQALINAGLKAEDFSAQTIASFLGNSAVGDKLAQGMGVSKNELIYGAIKNLAPDFETADPGLKIMGSAHFWNAGQALEAYDDTTRSAAEKNYNIGIAGALNMDQAVLSRNMDALGLTGGIINNFAASKYTDEDFDQIASAIYARAVGDNDGYDSLIKGKLANTTTADYIRNLDVDKLNATMGPKNGIFSHGAPSKEEIKKALRDTVYHQKAGESSNWLQYMWGFSPDEASKFITGTGAMASGDPSAFANTILGMKTEGRGEIFADAQGQIGDIKNVFEPLKNKKYKDLTSKELEAIKGYIGDRKIAGDTSVTDLYKGAIQQVMATSTNEQEQMKAREAASITIGEAMARQGEALPPRYVAVKNVDFNTAEDSRGKNVGNGNQAAQQGTGRIPGVSTRVVPTATGTGAYGSWNNFPFNIDLNAGLVGRQ